MTIADRLDEIRRELPASTRVVAVSKLHPVAMIREAYDAGQRIFGENRVQELVAKQALLPADIVWHLVGHLQTNKIKPILPFISMIESVDTYRLLYEINRLAAQCGRVVDVLLQIHIALEETKFGFSFEECRQMLRDENIHLLENVRICGLMGVATNTDDTNRIRSEFAALRQFFRELQSDFFRGEASFKDLSMGMSNDYPIAIEEGSTFIRIGSKIFGQRGA
ncbi:MAG: YggS family pyridoxal phosphate-dependent enzyme [Dysgonamonadaceae bacterium]|jgi:pyridoxal phosphate enzyme (YggS family)|nr:YggS family pyridoxal phosphate-dependent enzyme [Dysgonamonadaceae bacterium]